MKRITGFFAAMLAAVLLSGCIPEQESTGTHAPAAPSKEAEKKSTIRQHRSGTVVLEPDRRGHHIAEFRMNGKKVTAMVDTGASVVTLSRKTARKIGIRPAKADYTVQFNTANGVVKAAVVTIDRIKIGKIQLRNVKAAVLPDGVLASKTLLGMSFLGRLESFTFEDGMLILER